MRELFKKDIRLFVRDRKNLLLVLLTPVVIMVILGNVFSGTTKEEFLKNIRLGYCSDDPSFTFPYPFTLLTYPTGCTEKMNASVLGGRMRGAITIPADFTSSIREGHGSEIELYVDNAKPQTAFAIATAMEAFVNVMNEQIGVTFISEAWAKLRDLDISLAFAADHLDGAKRAALLLDVRTQNLSTNMDIVNISAAYDLVDKTEHHVNETLHTLNISAAVLPSLNITSLTIGPTPTLQNLSDTYDTMCVVCNESCTLPNIVCASINLSLAAATEALRQQQLSLLNRLNNLTSTLNQTTLLIGEYRGAANGVLAAARENVSAFDAAVAAVRSHLAAIDEAQTNAKRQLSDIAQLTHNYTQEIIALQEQLNATARFLSVYTKRDPRNIVRAVTLRASDTFPGDRPFSFMAPGIVVIVLMLITFLIASQAMVAERKAGTMMRNILSPMPLALFLLQKLLFLLLLCGVQLSLMVGVILLFGVVFPQSLVLLGVLLIVSLFLVSLGMLLGALSPSENTALLSSLVLSIPFMFLSGVFFAFESMPSQMALLGTYSPVTMAVSLLGSVVIYKVPLNSLHVSVLLGLAVFFFGCTYLLVKRSPTIE
ncbi:ABC transporter permease [Candidatus Woesearchaeota archaeon]|nr:ABC transporter permease [Candidatus Woesearchaeota archaeon]